MKKKSSQQIQIEIQKQVIVMASDFIRTEFSNLIPLKGIGYSEIRNLMNSLTNIIFYDMNANTAFDSNEFEYSIAGRTFIFKCEVQFGCILGYPKLSVIEITNKREKKYRFNV